MKNILIIAAVALAAWYFIKKKAGTADPVTSLWSGASGLLKSATDSGSSSSATPGAGRESSRTSGSRDTQTAATGDGTTTIAPDSGIPGNSAFTKIINRRIVK